MFKLLLLLAVFLVALVSAAAEERKLSAKPLNCKPRTFVASAAPATTHRPPVEQTAA